MVRKGFPDRTHAGELLARGGGNHHCVQPLNKRCLTPVGPSGFWEKTPWDLPGEARSTKSPTRLFYDERIDEQPPGSSGSGVPCGF